VCNGEVYYGQSNELTDDKLSFKAMSESGNFTKKKVNGSIECTNILFGGKFKWDAPNACFCEQYVKPGARRCAVEGEDCTCTGTVFIGKLNVDGVEPAPFK
jgi:hypothetical protein